jgi:serine/threonine-protein kinase
MPLTPGTRLGPYEILAPIGAGGMGEVYRARDPKLNRDVAIKVLPEAFAADRDRVLRFDREAQVLAAVNHPNIAQVFGALGPAEAGSDALVMELVDGEDLAARLRRGPVPLEDAISIARQICSALEAAHEKGIVHRDLKPGNIMVTADGTVKVLDFGLARMIETESGSSVSDSPTLTYAGTQAGVILGTAAYMAPEQARGRVADKRCDVWAFGCLLYEMLSGRRAFVGDEVADIVAAILRAEPDWNALPAGVPPNIRSVIQRCLVKDRKARIPDMAVVRFMLDEPPVPAATSAGAAPAGSLRQRILTLAGAGLAGVALATAVTWLVMRRPPEAVPSPVRFAIDVPFLAGNRTVVISADGQRVVYAAGSAGNRELFVRRIDRLEAEPLRGTANGHGPFLSPDGKWVGYFHGTTELRKIPIDGGPPMKICQISGVARGASWAEDDTIIFSAADSNTLAGLMRVPAAGGTPKSLTEPDGASEFWHVQPTMLPGGRGVLFTIHDPAFQAENSQVALLDLKTGTRKTLLRGGGRPLYVSSGHLLYTTAGSLHGVPFDLERLAVLGEPVRVLDGVDVAFSVSTNGTLVYLPAQANARSLVWMDRHGLEASTGAPARSYLALRLAPDGTRVALDIRDQESDIWIWDLARRTMQKLTFGPPLDMFPIWTPDSRDIIFTSGKTGTHNLYRQSADGSDAADLLTKASSIHTATSIAPDASSVLLTEAGEQGDDIMLLPLDGKGLMQPLLRTPFRERNAAISPDGRRVAYESDESGALQVFVRPFPDVNAGRWLVSPEGGSKPSWSRNGRELFYADSRGALISIPIETTSDFRTGDPVKLFDLRSVVSLTNGRPYDVTPDGQRFIVIREPPPDTTVANVPKLIVVLNWLSEASKRF